MIDRHITSHLLQALTDTPVVWINGARQTGKSTLVRSLELTQESRQYLTFDDPGIVAAAKRDPNGFVAGLDRRVTLDEVQHVPELFPAIKIAVDRKREPGRFLLTGSANVLLLPKLSESLAGRMEVLTLWPFSQGEIAQIQENFIDTLFAKQVTWSPTGLAMRQRNEIFEKMLAGGYPLVVERNVGRRKALFQSFFMPPLHSGFQHISPTAYPPPAPPLSPSRAPVPAP